MQDYDVLKFNLVDSQGEFTYKIKLSDRIWYDDDTGYLYCNDAVLGNVGVQLYKGRELGMADKNATVRVHRKAEDIFDQKSMDSLKAIPVTLEHPKVKVKSRNIKDHIRGAVYGEPKHDGENIICDIVIYDQDLIDLVAPENSSGERVISNEFRDLSLGYSAKLIPLDDTTGDFKQQEIKYNHLAVVKEGRAKNAMIRDSVEEDLTTPKERGKAMKIFDWLKGKKLQLNDDETFTVIDEEADKKEKVEEKPELKVEKTKDEEPKQEEPKQEENKEKEVKDIMPEVIKDKAYFAVKFADAKALPDGDFKQDVIKELNDEYATLFPRPVKTTEIKDSVAKDLKPENMDKVFKDTQEKEIDFEYIENESKIYYDKLTNPFAHASMEEYNKFYNSEVTKGKTKLNV